MTTLANPRDRRTLRTSELRTLHNMIYRFMRSCKNAVSLHSTKKKYENSRGPYTKNPTMYTNGIAQNNAGEGGKSNNQSNHVCKDTYAIRSAFRTPEVDSSANWSLQMSQAKGSDERLRHCSRHALWTCFMEPVQLHGAMKGLVFPMQIRHVLFFFFVFGMGKRACWEESIRAGIYPQFILIRLFVDSEGFVVSIFCVSSSIRNYAMKNIYNNTDLHYLILCVLHH